MSRLAVLKRLESTLESFLSRAVESEKGKIEALHSLETLEEMARDSLKGRHIGNRLGDWLARNQSAFQHDRFSAEDLTFVGNLLSDIRSGLDGADPESVKLSEEIGRLREKGVIPKRKLILKMKSRSTEEDDLLGKFVELSKREAEYVGSGLFHQRHLLSVLDDVLKSAAAKEDRMYVHLAGSIIYFLKMKGYRVEPFVKRLKEIENEKSGRNDE